MVAINKVLLPERTGEGCGGATGTCTDSRVHRRNAENRAPATRNPLRAVAFGRWLTRDPIGYQGGINLYGYVGSSPVGNVDASGEIWIGGENLSPPSPVPPPAPKKCCPPFPPLVKAWKRWVADYLEAKAMYSALVSQQRFAHGTGNGYDTVLAEYQNAKDTILIAEIYLQSVKLLARFGDIEILPAELVAEAKINRLKAQNRAIGSDVANLEGMYARSVPPFVEVSNYIKQLRKVGRAQVDYIEFSYYCD